MRLRFFLSLGALLAATATAHAHDYQLGELHIGQPFARPSVPGQTSGAAYLSIENRGKTGDKLIGAASPAARAVEIHTMSMEGNLMKMREAGEVAIAPSQKIVMQPGQGYHLMLLGLKQPLKAGDKLPLTLNFEKAGKTEVSVLVQDKDARAATMQEAGANQGQQQGMHHGH
ncbi:copper chaperone PCu(A)C [Noviherbaspirillum massiliense]|uniref:copper chaperone PCu(A)C n=1 Tax=Noviherbaspirillum massiliense TaxID=1465823 RepID=UPI0002D77553|nr:copper chaperone PCu(A)C [Noviherbaspirillum massiliense]